MPAAVVGGLPLLIAGWLFALSPLARDAGPTVPQIIGAICFGVAVIAVLGIVPAIYLFNLPKCFVPPHLRDQPGFVEDSAGRTGPAR
jgi:hypothetical protein